MSGIQTMTKAVLSSQAEDDGRSRSLRFTPLRSHVITRTLSGEGRSDRALSRIIPARRLRS